ncbi:MAG: adenosylcobinamide-GDP ribazoletransferase [Lawsonella clevelandensis]
MIGTQRPAFAWVVASIGALLFTGAAAVTSELCGRMPDVSVVVALLYSAAAVGGTVLYRRHCVRRLGYLTGDVLGANVELLQACGAVAAVCAVTALL